MPVMARFYGIIIKMYFSQSEHGREIWGDMGSDLIIEFMK